MRKRLARLDLQNTLFALANCVETPELRACDSGHVKTSALDQNALIPERRLAF